MIYIDDRNIMYCMETEKRCYSEREAGSILNSCRRHRTSDHCGRNKDLPRRKYWCNSCGHYHLTHTPYYTKDSRNAGWERRFYDECERKQGKKKGAA
ncbi:MAG: hypothetical protein HUK25_02060 [Treponema sp.]|nr:hypothetical protein [Treponema sp.]